MDLRAEGSRVKTTLNAAGRLVVIGEGTATVGETVIGEEDTHAGLEVEFDEVFRSFDLRVEQVGKSTEQRPSLGAVRDVPVVSGAQGESCLKAVAS